MNTATKTVFLLEDDAFDVAVLKRALSSSKVDASLEVATDGRDAIDKLNRFCNANPCGESVPCIAILDINVPCLSGFEVCDFLKRKEQLKDLPVVFFSGSSSSEDKNLALEVGAEAYFDKNDGAQSLINHITHYMDRHR